MSKIAGQLLWSRRQLSLYPGSPTELYPTGNRVNTGITQKSLAFGTDPVLDGADPTPGDQDGTPSRVQVIPLAPLDAWANVTHSEPYVDGGTVHVDFAVSGEVGTTLNVLFWNPHSEIGPGEAETYNTYAPN